ncbi:monooxygenase fmaE [Aspergillus undulatus]|uniref:monooxygenase fmaE n=1 Tax=Aspergillus undulatus TaxID=1810928 RepID=UPI003CCD5935
MAPLQPLFGPTTVPPESQLDRKITRRTLLLNNFQPSSWFLLAASLQGLLTWLFPTALTFIPAVLILAYRALDVLLTMYGLKSNPAMDGVITRKFSAQLPDQNGEFGERSSRDSVAVLLLGAKSNHPLGILYPAFLKVGGYLEDMVRDLEANREEYGFLTSTSYISNTDSTHNAAQATMTVYYFRTMAGVHKFAHGPMHRAGWDWWNRTAAEHPDISIMHEVYEAPAGQWETVYINYKPTGLASAVFPVSGEGEKGEKKWVGSIVGAEGANMKSARMRLGGTGDEVDD